jgi:hypothetical protein
MGSKMQQNNDLAQVAQQTLEGLRRNGAIKLVDALDFIGKLLLVIICASKDMDKADHAAIRCLNDRINEMLFELISED